jgi:hypothetical protein
VRITVANHLPSLLAHKPPESHPQTPVNFTGGLVFSFAYLGFTALAAAMPARVRADASGRSLPARDFD